MEIKVYLEISRYQVGSIGLEIICRTISKYIATEALLYDRIIDMCCVIKYSNYREVRGARSR